MNEDKWEAGAQFEDPLRGTVIQKPEWFKQAAIDAERQYKLINTGVLPEILRGNFVITMCLRLLRSIFGCESNLDAIEQLKLYVIRSDNYWRKQAYFDDHKN